MLTRQGLPSQALEEPVSRRRRRRKFTWDSRSAAREASGRSAVGLREPDAAGEFEPLAPNTVSRTSADILEGLSVAASSDWRRGQS